MFAFYLIYLYCDDHTENSAAEQEKRKERCEEEKLMKVTLHVENHTEWSIAKSSESAHKQVTQCGAILSMPWLHIKRNTTEDEGITNH